MTKPKAIQWLEAKTGAAVPYTSEPTEPRERHLSVRVDRSTAEVLDEIAAERGVTVSQLVRDLIAGAVESRRSTKAMDASALVERLAADVAEVRRRLAG